MVADWWAAMQRHGEQPPVMLAARRADVAALNRSARELLAASGVRGEEFAVGDRVIALRNAWRLGC